MHVNLNLSQLVFVNMSMPFTPKIYHIVHVDRLASILASNGLLCDAQTVAQNIVGSMIGMSTIKQRRLKELRLESYPDLYVGQCVPFYFCPRSIMLYVIHKADNEELIYRDGQESIIHLQADLYASVQWANQQRRRWAFTLSNAGSYYFEDRSDLSQLHELDWVAIHARHWRSHKEGKQAEFLMEQCFPWHLIEAVFVKSPDVYENVVHHLQQSVHQPLVTVKPDFYY